MNSYEIKFMHVKIYLVYKTNSIYYHLKIYIYEKIKRKMENNLEELF